MRALMSCLKKGRVALAALGVMTALAGTAAVTTSAYADEHGRGGYDRGYDHHGGYDRGDHWRGDHWRGGYYREGWREHYWRPGYRPYYPGYVYYPGPAYYPEYVYPQPGVSFGFNFR